MDGWQIAAAGVVAAALAALIAFVVWLRRSAMTPTEGAAALRTFGVDAVRLPGRLRRVAADPRTPRRAKWALVALALYAASPIDPIPDFLPVVGHLDEIVLVPLALTRIKRMVPPEVWADHFPARLATRDDTATGGCGEHGTERDGGEQESGRLVHGPLPSRGQLPLETSQQRRTEE